MTERVLSRDERELVTRVATELQFQSGRLNREAFECQEPTCRRELHETERAVIELVYEAGFEPLAWNRAVRAPVSAAGGVRGETRPVRGGSGVTRRKPTDGRRWCDIDTKRAATGRSRRSSSATRSGFAWLVIPAGEPVENRSEADQFVERVRHRLRALSAFDTGELFVENLVVIDGEPVVADHGVPAGV